MHAVSPQYTPAVKGAGTPIPQTSEEWEAELYALVDEIAEVEGIPHDVAFRYAQQRLQSLLAYAVRWDEVMK